MSDSAERRRFHRFPFHISGLVEVGRETHRCELVDISINGGLLDLGVDWPCEQGDRATLRLHLRGDVTDEKLDLKMALEVVRGRGRRIGCRWIGMEPDSFAALAKMVAGNLGDPALLDRELTQLDYWPGLYPDSSNV